VLEDSGLISIEVASAHALNQQSYVADADRGKNLYRMQAKVNNDVLKLQKGIIHFIANR
jgi:hypothetical protein